MIQYSNIQISSETKLLLDDTSSINADGMGYIGNKFYPLVAGQGGGYTG